MSTLIVDELFDGVEFSQEFRITKDTNLAHVRPWIYKHGTLVDGTFICEVYKGATLLAQSTISHTDINAAFTQQFAHGYIRFDFDSLSLKVAEENTKEEFSVKFYMQGHTSNPSNFIGIVRIWDIKIYETYGDGVVDGQAPNDMVEPAGVELYEYKLI